MKNLKKVLALVLVVATLMSFATVASAKFTDDSSIKYNEAVDVLTAINVINGYTDGSFRPEGNVTRAQMAKMVAYIVAGGEDVGNLYAGANTFSDCTTHWAKGYIAYANKTGIVAGVGGGKFNPDGNVTGTQAAKMMLVALGYDAAVEEYTGTNWAVNTLSDAKEAGLLKGLEGVDMSKAMTREQAAQLMFNALKADMVRYENKGSEVDLGNGVIIRPSASDAEVVTTTQSWGGNISKDGVKTEATSTNPYVVQLGEKYFDGLKLNAAASADNFGAPASVWTYKDFTGKYAKDPIVSYTDTVKVEDLKNDVEKAGYKITDGDVTVWSNGDDVKTAIPADSTEFGGKGVKVDVYAATDKDVADTIVMTYTYAAKVTSITEDDTDTTKDERAIEVTAYMGNSKTPTITLNKDTAGFDTVYAAVKENSIVLVTPKADKSDATAAWTVAIPESATGVVTQVTTGKSAVVGGTKYEYNKYIKGALAVDAEKEKVVYLDPYGYAIYVDDVASTETADVVYVTTKYSSKDAWGVDVEMFQGVLADGTVVTGKVSTDSSVKGDALTTGAYQYTKDGDTYKLTVAEGTSEKVGARKLNGADAITATSKKVDNIYFASDVNFVYVTGSKDDVKVTVKNGVYAASAADLDNAYGVIIKDSDGNYVVSTVFMATNAVSSSDDLIYVANAWEAEKYTDTKLSADNKKTLYGYEAYLNGEKTTIYLADKTSKSVGFYTYAVDDTTGAYELSTTAETNGVATGTIKPVYVNGNYYASVSGKFSDYDANSAKVVDVREDGKINSLSKLKDTDGTITATVLYNGTDEVVDYIYVTNVAG